MALACLVSLAGCARPYARPVVEPPDAGFDGIMDGWEADSAVDVISIHGMCSHETRWARDTSSRMAAALNLRFEPESDQSRTLGGIEWVTSRLTDAEGRVRVQNHAVVWSGMTAERKARLCGDSNEETLACPEPGYRKTRAALNGKLKSVLVNDCLSDAVIYLGAAGPVLREDFRRVVESIGEARSARQNAPLFIITESLGSKILLDAVTAPSGEDGQEIARILAPTRQIFMAANQAALLSLTEGEAPAMEGAAGDGLGQFLDRLYAARRAPEAGPEAAAPEEPITLVAFTDPNDLLSYALADRGDARVVNVTVSNDSTWFWLIENPYTAHTGYLEQDAVWELIACGSDRRCATE